MKKNILGLDIGVASVGWGVIEDDDNELSIKENGVRLFSQRDADQNKVRRDFRGARRNKRRKKTRLSDFEKIMSSYGIEKPILMDKSPIELRCKGLNEKLEEAELFVALYNLIKHRGISYLEDIEDVKGDVLKLMKSEIDELKYPCLIQKTRLEKYGKFRGTVDKEVEIENEDGKLEKKIITYTNVFPTQSYLDEAMQIINNQVEYYPNLNDFLVDKKMFNNDEIEYSKSIMKETSDYSEKGFNLKQAIIMLIRRKRKYYIGPGNEKSRTNYGRYKIDLNDDGTYKTVDNIFDELRGKCTIYSGKYGREALLRASKSSYTAQYYNCLNDLCNIKVYGEKLTKEQKEIIIKNILDSKSNVKLKFISKVCGCEVDDISGYRIDKDGKPLLHAFDEYRKLKKAIDIEIENIDSENKEKIMKIYNDFLINTSIIDEIYDIATLNTDIENIKPAINKFVIEGKLNETVEEFIIKYLKKECSSIRDWSSFSYKIMKKLIPEMLDTGDEQQTCLTRMGYFNFDNHDLKNKKSIPIEDILDEIYNPVVQRSIRQTLRIVNDLLKKYEFSDIIIEMPREKNDGDTRKEIEKAQKENEQELKLAIKHLGVEDKLMMDNEINYSSSYFKNHKQLPLKLRLAYRQHGKCLYSNSDIKMEVLLNDQNAYEIDHIIPLSISFNDSQQNKVLVLNDENLKKSNKTAYKYMQGKGESALAIYIANVNQVASDKRLRKWKENLLYKEDINKIDVRQGFINRNLNDTRYASREILNQLQNYFAAHGRNTKVKVVNGAFTSQFRKKYVKLTKDRDKNHAHHGVDALIAAISAVNLKKYNNVFNTDTGEISDLDYWNKLDEDDRNNLLYGGIDYHVIRCKLEDAEEKMKFSWKIDKKINRNISDQTIYGTRKFNEDIYIVESLDLYDSTDKTNLGKIKKLVDKLNGVSSISNIYLMELHDVKTWETLKKVVKTYPREVNPFNKYVEVEGEKIRKYSKKNNGPFIQTLKYNSKKLGSHLDITSDKNAKNKTVLLSLNPFRAECFYDFDKKVFRIVQLYYSDFKFTNGNYQIDIEKYIKRLFDGKVLNDSQLPSKDVNIEEIEKIFNENDVEFRFSLFGNDILDLEYEDSRRDRIVRYKSATLNDNSVYCDTINGEDFINNKNVIMKQPYYKYSDALTIIKINTDILGNEHRVFKEKLILNFVLDNKMIK
ncbi:CRISPR-associated endonuclease Csn1 [Bacilli bacterium PM5-3]|nr:CRISPR-associated endonuclease Csn1 [Bacilli bacterium PM5-3]